MLNFRKHILVKAVSIVVIIAFLTLDLAQAYPNDPAVSSADHNLSGQGIFQARMLTQAAEQFRGSILNEARVMTSVYTIADYLYDESKDDEALPIEHLETDMRAMFSPEVLEGIKLENVLSVGYLKKAKPGELEKALAEMGLEGYMPDDEVLLIPYEKEGIKQVIQVAPQDNTSVSGIDLVVNGKYTMKVLSEGYIGEKGTQVESAAASDEVKPKVPSEDVAEIEAVGATEAAGIKTSVRIPSSFKVKAVLSSILLVLMSLPAIGADKGFDATTDKLFEAPLNVQLAYITLVVIALVGAYVIARFSESKTSRDNKKAIAKRAKFLKYIEFNGEYVKVPYFLRGQLATMISDDEVGLVGHLISKNISKVDTKVKKRLEKGTYPSKETLDYEVYQYVEIKEEVSILFPYFDFSKVKGWTENIIAFRQYLEENRDEYLLGKAASVKGNRPSSEITVMGRNIDQMLDKYTLHNGNDVAASSVADSSAIKKVLTDKEAAAVREGLKELVKLTGDLGLAEEFLMRVVNVQSEPEEYYKSLVGEVNYKYDIEREGVHPPKIEVTCDLVFLNKLVKTAEGSAIVLDAGFKSTQEKAMEKEAEQESWRAKDLKENTKRAVQRMFNVYTKSNGSKVSELTEQERKDYSVYGIESVFLFGGDKKVLSEEEVKAVLTGLERIAKLLVSPVRVQAALRSVVSVNYTPVSIDTHLEEVNRTDETMVADVTLEGISISCDLDQLDRMVQFAEREVKKSNKGGRMLEGGTIALVGVAAVNWIVDLVATYPAILVLTIAIGGLMLISLLIPDLAVELSNVRVGKDNVSIPFFLRLSLAKNMTRADFYVVEEMIRANVRNDETNEVDFTVVRSWTKDPAMFKAQIEVYKLVLDRLAGAYDANIPGIQASVLRAATHKLVMSGLEDTAVMYTAGDKDIEYSVFDRPALEKAVTLLVQDVNGPDDVSIVGRVVAETVGTTRRAGKTVPDYSKLMKLCRGRSILARELFHVRKAWEKEVANDVFAKWEENTFKGEYALTPEERLACASAIESRSDARILKEALRKRIIVIKNKESREVPTDEIVDYEVSSKSYHKNGTYTETPVHGKKTLTFTVENESLSKEGREMISSPDKVKAAIESEKQAAKENKRAGSGRKKPSAGKPVKSVKDKPEASAKPKDTSVSPLYDLVTSVINNDLTKLIKAGNKVSGYLVSAKMLAEGADLSVSRDMTAVEIKVRLDKIVEIVESLDSGVENLGVDEVEVPKDILAALEEMRNLSRTVVFDSIVASLIVLARKAKRKGQNLVIGLEMDWIPGQEKSDLEYRSLNPLIKEIGKINELLKDTGLDNVVVVPNAGDALATDILDAAQSTGTDLSNVVVLASKATIDSPAFNSLRTTVQKEKAFLGAVDATGLQAQFDKIKDTPDRHIDVDITGMISIMMELASGKDLIVPNKALPFVTGYDKVNKRLDYFPKMTEVDFQELIELNKGRLQMLRSA